MKISMKKTGLFSIVLIAACLWGCNIFNLSDSLDELEPQSEKKEIAIRFKLDGKTKEMEAFNNINITQVELGKKEVAFHQMFYEEINFTDYLSLTISVTPYSGVGKFSIEKGVAEVIYSEVKNISSSQDWKAVKGTLEITSVKNNVMEGLVNATLVHEKKQRPDLEITDGKFKVEIKEL